MAPPRRKPLDPSTAPKHLKKSKAPTYDTFDEALDGGVELAEKGERYRTGDKAKRFFEEACKLYEKAILFDPKAFEGHYNLAGTLFTLVQSFLLPPLSLNTLHTSIAHYRIAQTLTTAPQLWVDATYNLAVGLITLADLMEDLQEADEKDGEVEGLRREAAGWLVGVGEKQEEMLRGMEQGDGQIDVGEEMEEAQETEEAEDIGAEDAEAAQKGTGRVWQETVTTPSLLLDTYILLLSTLSLLASSPTTSSSPKLPDVPSLLQKIHSIEPLCARSGAPRSVDVLVAEASARLSAIRSAFDQGLEGWSEECRNVIERLKVCWDQVKDLGLPSTQGPGVELEIKVSVICTLGDAYSLLALLLRLTLLRASLHIQTPPTPSETQEIWKMLSLSTQSSNTALSLLTPSQQAFPSSSPNKGETSPILLALSSLSLRRAQLADEPWMNPSAVKSRGPLITNAATYSKRAAEGSGTGWQAALAPWPGSLGWQARPSWVDGGWEVEQTAREAILLNLRSQFYKASSPEGSADALQDVQKTLLKAKGRLQTGDVRRFARELVEDEGVLKGGPGGEEEKFWEEVVNALYA